MLRGCKTRQRRNKKSPGRIRGFSFQFLFLTCAQLEAGRNANSGAGFYSDILSLRPSGVIDQEFDFEVRLRGGRGPLPSFGVDVFHDRSVVPAQSWSISS